MLLFAGLDHRAVAAERARGGDRHLGARTKQRPELELIGFFVNTLPLRVPVALDSGVKEFLEQVRATTLRAFDHRDVPFEQIVEESMSLLAASATSPIFQVLLAPA